MTVNYHTVKVFVVLLFVQTFFHLIMCRYGRRAANLSLVQLNSWPILDIATSMLF